MTRKPEPVAGHPLTSRGLHRKDDKGCVRNQAVVLDVFPSNSPTGDLAIIQFFDWIAGQTSTQAVIPVTALAGPEWVLYASVEEMNEHYERVDKHFAIAARQGPPDRRRAPDAQPETTA